MIFKAEKLPNLITVKRSLTRANYLKIRHLEKNLYFKGFYFDSEGYKVGKKFPKRKFLLKLPFSCYIKRVSSVMGDISQISNLELFFFFSFSGLWLYRCEAFKDNLEEYFINTFPLRREVIGAIYYSGTIGRAELIAEFLKRHDNRELFKCLEFLEANNLIATDGEMITLTSKALELFNKIGYNMRVIYNNEINKK